MLSCDTVQARLSGDDAASAGVDPDIRKHLEDCESCRRFAAALTELDRGIGDLPEEHAPTWLVERVAREVEKHKSTRRATGPFGGVPLATVAASVLVAAALVGVIDNLPLSQGDATPPGWVGITSGLNQTAGLRAPIAKEPGAPQRMDAVGGLVTSAGKQEGRSAYHPPENEEAAAFEPRVRIELPMREFAPQSAKLAQPDVAATFQGNLGDHATASEAEPASEELRSYRQNAPPASPESVSPKEPLAKLQHFSRARVTGQAIVGFDDDEAKGRASGPISSVEAAPSEETRSARGESKRPQPTQQGAGAKRKRQKREVAGNARLSESEDKELARVANALPAVERMTDDQVVANRRPRLVATRFLDERETLEGLQFLRASGYWSNTYRPGDPEMRLLAARLRAWDRSTLLAKLGGARLEAGARPNLQPFDPPQGAALAAYLHAGKAALAGASRLRIQVGLKATERGRGHRPAVNAALVLDVRVAPSAERRAAMQALVMSLARSAQPGDRFTLVAAGPGGGLMVEPDEFRHGTLRVALQRLFQGAARPDAATLTLPEAISTATDVVRRSDDPSAPLGASLILLAAAGSVTADRSVLERMIHDNAVAGIVFSAVALGSQVESASIDRLVLLGQGHRRALASPDDAPQFVDRELFAAARAVARAVRLRIRLAPGVELVRVIGAERLDETESERVRESERSIDRRLAQNLGIEADRGEDEEGIQIVIPSFYSGDDHAVLIDVVAPRPGPIADLTVRYKDLVYLRNGVARTRLTIPSGDRPPGPLERNVLKNELTLVLSRIAREAGERLARGDRSGAATALASTRALFRGLRRVVPGWSTDPELLNDEAMLDEYLAALSSSMTHAAGERKQLARSLRYLAYRRLLPAAQ